MFILRVHDEELNKTRKTRVEDLKTAKELIEKLYNIFIERCPHYKITVEIKGIDDEEPIFVCIESLDFSNKYMIIKLYKPSKEEVDNEQFSKDWGINIDN